MDTEEVTSVLAYPVAAASLACFELQITRPDRTQTSLALTLGQQSLDELLASPEHGWEVRTDDNAVTLQRLRGDATLSFHGEEHEQQTFHAGDCFRLLQHVCWVVDVRNPYVGQLEGHSHDYSGKIWNLSFRPYLVGRRSSGRQNDIELNDSTVSRVQATLFAEESGDIYLLSETSKSPVVVNGVTIPQDEQVRLRNGDVLLFGQLTFRYRQLSFNLFPGDGSLPKSIGGYKIVGKLGSGGMGVVYAGVDAQGKEVAIKVPLPNLVQDEEFTRRFNREMTLGSTLKHPRLTEIFHFEPAGEGRYPFLVMEKLGQSDLSEIPLPVPTQQALEWIDQLLEGLECLHSAGVVHRDLKPANLYRTPDGLKVADLGLAHLKDGDGQTVESGAVLGTPAYLDPAVLRGHPCEARSDLYAVGVILYEWLTGPLPYPSDPLQIYRLKLTEDLPPLGPEFCSSLRHFVDLLMNSQPERRFRSAHEALHALRELRESDPEMSA